MPPYQDYVYRYTPHHASMAGRCRVRIYARERGARVVLMTELNDNPGESIASASEYIATGLTARWGLKTHLTRWIFHDALAEEPLPLFHEIQFAWDAGQNASDPTWREMDVEEVLTLTGESGASLERRIGEPDAR